MSAIQSWVFNNANLSSAEKCLVSVREQHLYQEGDGSVRAHGCSRRDNALPFVIHFAQMILLMSMWDTWENLKHSSSECDKISCCPRIQENKRLMHFTAAMAYLLPLPFDRLS